MSTFVEGADGRLINKVRPAGIDESFNNRIAHLQWTANTADAGSFHCRVLHIIVGTEGRVTEGGLRLTVPYFNIILFRELFEIPCAVVVSVIVISGDRSRIP
ncbi:hypothetical protein D3C78_1342820 [compost metagenome]